MHHIYSTFRGKISQDDKQNCFNLLFNGNNYRLTACALIALKIRLDSISVEEKLLEDVSINTMEIIPLCNMDRVLTLSLDEIIELKDLIPGSLVMLELNSIVNQRIVRAFV